MAKITGFGVRWSKPNCGKSWMVKNGLLPNMFVRNTKGICLRQAEVSYVLTYDMFRFSASMVHVHRNIEFMVKLHM